MLVRKDKQWVPVSDGSGYGVERDRFNAATFTPIETDAVRLEVQLGRLFRRRAPLAAENEMTLHDPGRWKTRRAPA